MTIKKLTALLLAVAMLFTLAACDNAKGKDGGTTTTTTGNSNSTTTTTEDTTTTTTTASNEGTDAKAFAIGTNTGDTYENTFIGIGFKAEGDMELSSDEDIRDMNVMMMEDEPADYLAALKELDAITDMMATDMTTGDSVNINLENMKVLYGSVLSESDYLDQNISMMEDMAEEGLTVEKATFTLAGKERQGVTIIMDIMGIKVYEAVVCIKVGDYMVNITVGSSTEEGVPNLLAKFYAV